MTEQTKILIQNLSQLLITTSTWNRLHFQGHGDNTAISDRSRFSTHWNGQHFICTT